KSRSNHSTSRSRNVISQTQTRREIISVRTIQALETGFTHDEKGAILREIRKLPIHLSPWRRIVIPKAEVDGHLRCCAPAVLTEKSIVRLAVATSEEADDNGRFIRLADKKVSERSRTLIAP